MRDGIGKCEICGHSPTWPWKDQPAFMSALAVHEIARGTHRQKAVDKRYATLVVCGVCHERLGSKADWPEARQLAVVKFRRPKDYSLVAYNELVNPRAPQRITEEEVNRYLP